jgi:hypothetical protein
MSVIFRIKTVYIKDKTQEEARAWLEERKLKPNYGNSKYVKTDEEGFVEYKQRSHAGKVDHEQTTKVKIEEGIYVLAEYRYMKLRTERKKRGFGNGPGGRKAKKQVNPESEAANPRQDSGSEPGTHAV